MEAAGVGFVVLYRWTLRPGQEQAFVAAWSRVTKSLLGRGSLGSRLHRGPDGVWYGYAQWPSEDARAKAFETADPDDDAWDRMQASVAGSLPEVRLWPVADFLVTPTPVDAPGSSPQ